MSANNISNVIIIFNFSTNRANFKKCAALSLMGMPFVDTFQERFHRSNGGVIGEEINDSEKLFL